MTSRAETKDCPPISRRAILAGIGLATGTVSLLSKANAVRAAVIEQPGSNPILGNGGVHHAGVFTREWDRSLGFYEKGLGFSVMLGFGTTPHRNAFLDGGFGTGIELSEATTFVPRSIPDEDLPLNGPTWETVMSLLRSHGPLSHLALRTTRLNIAFERAKPFAAKVILPPTDNPLPTTTGQGTVRTRLCYLEGPSGEWVELVEMPPWA